MRKGANVATAKNPILAVLKKATQGLLFISETEAKFTPFVWQIDGAMNVEQVFRNAEYDYEAGTPTEKMSLADFFRAVPPEDAPKYDSLTAVLKEQLADLEVYKIGAAEKDVYIVGRTKDGLWAGLTTTVVET